MNGRSHFVRDFPGVPAFLFFLVLAAFFWPWAWLHGDARYAVGIPWTGTALLIGALVVRAKLNGARR